MAQSTKNTPTTPDSTSQTPEGRQAPRDTAASTQQADTVQQEDTRTSASVDVVAMPSIRADGTPDQTPGFKTVEEVREEQAEPVAGEAPSAVEQGKDD